MNEYEFKTNLCCDFVTPELDEISFKMVAEYTVDYEGSIYIDRIVTASKNPKALEITIMHFLNDQKDFDHLIDEIDQYLEDLKNEPRES